MVPDFASIDRIFEGAEKDNRSFLFEHEVYKMLRKAGLQTPKFLFLPKGIWATQRQLSVFKSSEVVLKVVAPGIQHKTDSGGVMFVERDAASVNAGLGKMISAVPRRFRAWLKSRGDAGERIPSLAEIERDIRGVLICEKVDFARFGFGTELLIGIRNSREFGPVVTMGVGGVEVEYLNERLKEGRAASIASAHLVRKKDILKPVEPLAVYDKLVRPFRGRAPVLSEDALRETMECFQELAVHYSSLRSGGGYVIEEAEVNPFVVRGGRLVPLDGRCRFSRLHTDIKNRPYAEIGHLLRPSSIAVIGVSERMNLGHIVLMNVLKQGFPREKVYVVKAGPREIEGCLCFPDIASLPKTVDLFVLTLPAASSRDVLADLIAYGKARSMIIIAGGLGEKKGTQSLEEMLVDLVARSRKEGKLTPVINGGNCLGIYSKPGRYDTTFIPERKMKFPKSEPSTVVHVSQSGAFMLCRISRLHRLEPLYAVSLGNQIDLRVSDYLNYLRDSGEAKVFAVYVEGFKPGDGYLLAEACRKILRSRDRHVVVYKSGRTPEGRKATSSHTASVAGDYGVCKAVLEEAGVIMADSIFEFESFVNNLSALSEKEVRGRRVGLISNAGFESVIMSDSLADGDRLELAGFSEKTKKRLTTILSSLGIDRLQDIKNPLDTTPVADDAAFCECARAILDDPGVDSAVVSPVPMTPAMQTLPPAEGNTENMYSPESTPSRLIEIFKATAKPFVVNIDAGAAYDPLAALMEDAGLPVFRRSDEAVKFLRKYIGSRLRRGRR